MDAEPLADELPERRVAGTGAVREDRAAVSTERDGGAVGELFEREQVRARPVRREIDRGAGRPAPRIGGTYAVTPAAFSAARTFAGVIGAS